MQPAPKIYAICLPIGQQKYQLLTVAQDGKELYGEVVASRSDGRYAMRSHAHIAHREHYPDGFEIVDLTRLTPAEIEADEHLMTILRMNSDKPK